MDSEDDEWDSFLLFDRLVYDIQRLMSKVVCLRYSLSCFLGNHEGEMLRCDILSDLVGAYYDLPAYQRLVSEYYDGHDPFENECFNDYLLELSIGDGVVDF